MNWISFLTEQVAKLPLERLFVRPPDNKKRLEYLQEILSESHAEPVEAPLEAIPEEAEEGYLEPRRQKVHLESPPANGISTEETVAYENREIAKNLLSLEKHYAQKLRINGVACDCGSGRHLLAIESHAEDTISMVDNPDVYYRLLDWVKEVSPKSTDQAAKSGKYDNEYPAFSRQARDFRKELIGSLEPSALFTKKVEELPTTVEEDRKELLAKGFII